MGACQSSNDDSTVSKKADKAIDKHTERYKNLEKIKYKLLLLGAGESGKSTLLKQMREAFGRSYETSELLAAKPHLSQNVIEAMRTLAIYSEILSDQGHETKVSPENQDIRDRVARMNDKQPLTKQHCADFSALWADEGIQNTLTLRHKFQLIDTVSYLLERMDKYCEAEYVPTFQDLIHSRQRTTGVNKIKFQLSDRRGDIEEIYEIFDVGGQKNERRKWMHFFDNTTAIIFVAALSGFNQLLWEDNRNNRMREAIGLFRGIVNLEVFKSSHVIMFLNKEDLFVEKIKHFAVREFFKDFKMGLEQQTKENVIEFFQNKFRDQRRNRGGDEERKSEIHFHVTCATDSDCVRKMFESCRTIIIKKELQVQGFL